MSSFGHVRDMMERYAANRELLIAKRNRHFRKTHLYDDVKFSSKAEHLVKLNKEELENLKSRIRKDKKRELRLWIVSSIVVLVSLLWMIHILL